MKQRLVVGYSEATDPAWDTNIIPHASAIHAVIVTGPKSGPGAAYTPSMAGLCVKLRAAGIKVFGYVYSGININLRSPTVPNVYGGRPLSELKADIDNWNEWYGIPLEPNGPKLIEGIFVDEVSQRENTVEYYRGVVELLNVRQGCVLNFGAVPPGAFSQLRATLCIAETSLEKYMTLNFPAWVYALPAEQFYHIIFGMKQEDVPRALARVLANRVGFYDLSGANADNPQFGVGTTLFQASVPTPAPEDPNWASLTLLQGLRAIGASPDSTAKDLVPLITAMVQENANLKAGISKLTNAQIVADLTRRLGL